MYKIQFCSSFKCLDNLQSLSFLLSTNFNWNCWETINTLQFLYTLFYPFPIFSVHVNWIAFYVTAYLKVLISTDITHNMSRSNETWTWNNNSVSIWKMRGKSWRGKVHGRKQERYTKRQEKLIKIDSNTGFSCKYCEIFKNSYFEKHLQTADVFRNSCS